MHECNLIFNLNIFFEILHIFRFLYLIFFPLFFYFPCPCYFHELNRCSSGDNFFMSRKKKFLLQKFCASLDKNHLIFRTNSYHRTILHLTAYYYCNKTDLSFSLSLSLLLICLFSDSSVLQGKINRFISYWL